MSETTAPATRPPLGGVRRLYLYVMAFAGLMAVLVALNSLASIAMDHLLQSGTLLSAADTRQRGSFSLAGLAVGLPVWLGHWLIAERAAARDPSERQSLVRRTFVAAVLAVTAIVVLFALRDGLAALFTLSLPATLRPTPVATAEAAVRLLLFGAAWLANVRVGAADRRQPDAPAVDQPHDLALYVVTGCSLVVMLAAGLQLLSLATSQLLHLADAARVMVGSSGVVEGAWGRLGASLVAGALVWALLNGYDGRRLRPHRWRTLYLYAVLVVVVPAALSALCYLCYELLRLGFGYRPESAMWDFVQTSLPWLLIGTAAALYHWRSVRAEAAFREPEPGAVFAAPRRPGVVLLALLGLFAAAPAFGSLLWVGLDWAFPSGVLLAGQGWWRDRTSFSLAAGVAGGVVWLWTWLAMQRAAKASPSVEGAATARRVEIAAVVIVGAVAALGFAIAVLWRAFSVLLGEPFTASQQSLLLKLLSSLLVATGVAVYHALVLRSSGGLRRATMGRRHLLAVLTPGSEAALDDLRRLDALHVQLIGQLASAPPPESDLGTLTQRVDSLGRDGTPSRALLILQPEGGSLYPLTS